MTTSPMFCEHANEVPAVCPCGPDCYCRVHGSCVRRKPAGMDPEPGALSLAPGRFYASRDGHVWCCFRVDDVQSEHAKASCIRVFDERVEHFFQDGRYDSEGRREHTLVAEVRL